MLSVDLQKLLTMIYKHIHSSLMYNCLSTTNYMWITKGLLSAKVKSKSPKQMLNKLTDSANSFPYSITLPPKTPTWDSSYMCTDTKKNIQTVHTRVVLIST